MFTKDLLYNATIRSKLNTIVVPEISKPGSRKLIPEKVDEYITKSKLYPEIDQKIVEMVLKNTWYITSPEMNINIDDSIDQLLKVVPEGSFIAIDLSRPSSDLWLLARNWKKLKRFNLLDISSIMDGQEFKTPPPEHIILLDDVLYSGIHLIVKIDNLTYDWSKSKMFNGVMPKFYLVTGYMSDGAYQFINSFGDDERKITIEVFSHRIDIISPYEKLQKIGYSDIEAADAIEFIGSEGGALPIYLEHSVGKYASSFPGVYLEGRLGEDSIGALIPPIDRGPINYVYEYLSLKSEIDLSSLEIGEEKS